MMYIFSFRVATKLDFSSGPATRGPRSGSIMVAVIAYTRKDQALEQNRLRHVR